MKNKKLFLFAVLPALTISLLAGCNKQKVTSSEPQPDSSEPEPEEDKPLEIGDTVKEWTSEGDFEQAPLAFENDSDGTVAVIKDKGNLDDSSLKCTFVGKEKVTLGSDYVADPYFIEDDAKNGDIISLEFFVPNGGNIASVQLVAYPSSMNNPIEGEVTEMEGGKYDKWIRTVVSFDTLETLGAIRVNLVVDDKTAESEIYIDDINITLGEETVTTGYEYNDESLYQRYEDYFKVGTCMSASMLRNTELRKIAKNDFNSITAENEGKPEHILDQEACQEAAKVDNGQVVIKTSPFEKLYSWCEANHIGVRHHTFVWYSQTPAWFFTEDYTANGKKASRQLMLERMENFIRETLEAINDRWPGLVYAIDVANEAIENGGTRTNNNNWYSTVGDDFVYYAFKYASMYKEDYQDLYYNDFSFDYNHSHCQYAVNTLLKDAIAEGIIDGVGIQGHIDDDQDMHVVIDDAKLIYEKGLKCQITELDIETRGSGDNKFTKQKNAYALLIKKVLEANYNEETDINAVIVWGITDNNSWKYFQQRQEPLLYDAEYAKKPAYYGFYDALDEFEANL